MPDPRESPRHDGGDTAFLSPPAQQLAVDVLTSLLPASIDRSTEQLCVMSKISISPESHPSTSWMGCGSL